MHTAKKSVTEKKATNRKKTHKLEQFWAHIN